MQHIAEGDLVHALHCCTRTERGARTSNYPSSKGEGEEESLSKQVHHFLVLRPSCMHVSPLLPTCQQQKQREADAEAEAEAYLPCASLGLSFIGAHREKFRPPTFFVRSLRRRRNT